MEIAKSPLTWWRDWGANRGVSANVWDAVDVAGALDGVGRGRGKLSSKTSRNSSCSSATVATTI